MPFALQLKNNTIHISQGDIASLIENRNKALTELDQKTAESLRKLDEKALAVQKEVKNVAVAAKRTVSMKKRVAIYEINTAEKQAKRKIDDGISEIEKSVKKAKKRIVREKVRIQYLISTVLSRSTRQCYITNIYDFGKALLYMKF
jgi:phenylalanyl-tRNA synthetase alpha subunit